MPARGAAERTPVGPPFRQDFRCRPSPRRAKRRLRPRRVGIVHTGWLGRALLHHYRWRRRRARPSQLQPTIRPLTVPSLRPIGVRVRERKKKGGAESRHETRLTHVEGRGIPPTSTGPPRLCPSHPRHPLQGAAVPSVGTLPLPRNPGSKDVQRQAEHFFRPTPSPGPPRSGLPLLNRSTQGVLVGPCCPSSHPRPSSPSLARKSTRRFDGFSASLSRCVLGGPGWAQMDFSMADAR